MWVTKYRYKVFKAIFGTSENAVKTQAWVAIAVYALVAIVKKTAQGGGLPLHNPTNPEPDAVRKNTN